MNKNDFKRMRAELTDVVRHMCSVCSQSPYPEQEPSYMAPDICDSQCEKVTRIRRSIDAIDDEGNCVKDAQDPRYATR